MSTSQRLHWQVTSQQTQNFKIDVNDVRETLAIVSRIAADHELRLCIGVDSASGTDADGARNLSLALEHDLHENGKQELIINLEDTNIDKMAIVVGRLGVIICRKMQEVRVRLLIMVFRVTNNQSRL